MDAVSIGIFELVTKLVPEFSAASKVVVALQLLLSGYQVAYAGTIMLVVTSFMDTLVEMMGETTNSWSTTSANTCLQLYRSFETGMGPYFVLIFSISQTMWILYTFLFISNMMAGFPDHLLVSGLLCCALATVLQVGGGPGGVPGGLPHLHHGPQPHHAGGDRLHGQEAGGQDAQGRGEGAGEAADKGDHLTELKKTDRKFYIGLQEVEVTGPLKGMGLFTMERSTITSMVSTALTYIIILVQFRMST